MIGPHTRVVLQRNTKYKSCADITVQHTGQCIGWMRVYEVAQFLRTLGIYVRFPDGEGWER